MGFVLLPTGPFGRVAEIPIKPHHRVAEGLGRNLWDRHSSTK
jgi:hypothetical protein